MYIELTYPWFLMGLLGVSTPIIIHLFQMRWPKRLLFTNTAFIREIELVAVRHRKVQYLLLLLVRVLGIAALVFVFCQPFIASDGDGLARNGGGIDVMVDNSLSMQLQGTVQGSVFEEAVVAARNLGRLVSADTRFRLVNSGGLINRGAYQTKLSGLKLTARASFSNSKISGAADGRNENSNQLYIFSDFQKNIFNAQFLNGLSGQQQVVLAPLVGQKVQNVYVDSVWVDDAFVRVRTNVGLHVRLRNGGGLVAVDCPVKVFFGGRQVAAFRVTVGVGQVETSVVQVQVNDGAIVEGRVVTEDVPVTFDNTYYFTLQPARTIRIVEVGTEPVAQQLYGNEPLFTYSFAKPRQVNYDILRQANLVLVREVNEVDAGLREGLRAVLKRGGSVVVVPSALPAGHNSYEQLFKELGVGVVQWGATTASPELREVAMPNVQEPFFRDVFGAQQRSVTMPQVAPLLRWSRTGADILRLRDGESYLADFGSGAGRVYVFSAPFSAAYSNFIAHALFVPVMYRMAMLSYRTEQLPAYRLTDGAVTLSLPIEPDAGGAGRADEAGIRFVKDSLTLIPGQRVVEQQVRLELPVGMDTPGFYQVQRRGKVLTTVALNQNKRESELAAYSADELRAMIGPNRPNIRVVEGGADGVGLAKFQAAQAAQPLWRYFLVVALGCLLMEGVLLRFGGRRAGAKPVKMAA